MKQHLALTAVVVKDYDEAIAFYVDTLGFELVEDSYQPEQDKRWVVVAPPGDEDPTGARAGRCQRHEREPCLGTHGRAGQWGQVAIDQG